MFKLTAALVAHAVKEWGLDSELAKDIETNREAITKHFSEGIVSGDIDNQKVAELQAKDDKTEGEKLLAKAVSDAQQPVLDAITKQTDAMTQLVKQLSGGKEAGGDGASATDPQGQPSGDKALSGGNADPKNTGAKAYQAAAASGDSTGSADGGTGAGGEPRVDVKSIKSMYDTTLKAISSHPRIAKCFASSITSKGDDGIGERIMSDYSQLGLAVAGATMKYLVTRSSIRYNQPNPRWAKMTEHDHKLMQYAAHEMEWLGPVGMRGDDDEDAEYGFATGKRLNDIQTKAVLDDATSGGLEAVPIVFDDIAVLTPLLVSQILPRVTMRTTTRRRVEGFKAGNPNMYWTAEGTTPTEFSTSGFISEFNTTIHPCVGWMELGLDFQEDSPVDIANIIIGRYALRAMNEMENKIATGSGSGEPLGITNTPSLINVNSANGATGPLTVGDFESLYHAIPVEFRQEAEATGSLAWLGNSTNYQRAKGISVGSSDARRIFGMNQQADEIMGIDYPFNGQVANTTMAAVCYNRYTMYRRAGFDVRRVTEDADLAKKNQELLVARFRVGGQMNHGNAVAMFSDGQA